MIESLYIENFAIIDQVQIDFQSGMTVLTGETGAGKSIIIDAIGQLIGQRSQPSFVKNGADYAFIEGVFSSNKEIDKILLDNKIKFLCIGLLKPDLEEIFINIVNENKEGEGIWQ